MRLAKASAVAGAAALLISAMTALPAARAQQDADKKVAGGGITVKGWQGRVDTGNRQGLTINDSKLAPEGSWLAVDDRSRGTLLEPGEHGQG